MPDHTTTSAAAYLAAHGYTVKRRKVGGEGAPNADTIKHWCEQGKIPGARRAGRPWLIPQSSLDRLLGLLVCSCCGAPMAESEAVPAPAADAPRYHQDFAACVRVALANLAVAKPHLRAMLGAPEEPRP